MQKLAQWLCVVWGKGLQVFMQIYHLDVRLWGEFTLIYSMKAREYWRGNATCRNGDLFFDYLQTLYLKSAQFLRWYASRTSFCSKGENPLRHSTDEKKNWNSAGWLCHISSSPHQCLIETESLMDFASCQFVSSYWHFRGVQHFQNTSNYLPADTA